MQAAVGERAEQPVDDLGHRERVGREIERQRRQRAGEAVDGDAGQDQRHRAGALAGDAIEHEGRNRGTGNAAERQHQRRRAGETEIEDDDRAERRHARHAGDAGLGQRIAQQPLHGRAGDAEAEADQRAEDHARNAQFDQHQCAKRRASLQRVGHRLAHIERRVADGERAGGQHDDQQTSR